MVEIHTYIFHHGDCQNLIGHCHVSWGWHSIVDLQLHNREIKKTVRGKTWIINESADCRSHRGGRDNVVPEKLQQFAVTLGIQNQSSGELFMEKKITHWQTTNLSVFVSILTSGLMRYFRCSSIIASNAAVVGASTVIGPGWSSKDARGVFCSEHKLSNLINLQFRNLRTRSSCTWMCY